MLKKNKLLLFGFLLLGFLIYAGFFIAQRYKERERLNNSIFELKFELHRIQQTEHPWRMYLEKRHITTLSSLKGKSRLDKLYVTDILATPFESDDSVIKIRFNIRWLEDGFKSCGAKLSLVLNGSKEIIDIPFPENIWDASTRKWYADTCKREFTFAIVQNENQVKNLPKQVEAIVVHPVSVMPENGTISVYDSRGQVSRPVEIFFFEKNTEK